MPRRSLRSGFSLIEIAVVMVLLLIAIGGLSSAVVSSVHLSRANDQTSVADEAARRMVAQLRTVDFADIFASFNTDPNDDPGVPGSAPGPDFAVRSLNPRRDDGDGFVGRIIFPEVPMAVGGVGLDETFFDASLGMPRDLNADADADDQIQTGYVLLPVTVRLDWIGAAGNRWIELHTILTE